MTRVRAVKVTPEMRARASREYYEKQPREFRLTEGQRRQILANGESQMPAR